MRFGILLVAVAVVASAGCSSGRAAPLPTPSRVAAPSPSSVVAPSGPDRCAADALVGDLPSWSASARPPQGVYTAISRERNALAVVFAHPLRAGERDDGMNNKILWIVQDPRNGRPLHLTATLPGEPAVSYTQPADSGPGQIYPSGIDVPVPGCWSMALEWDGHHATVALRYER
jgi:hypothetical protein